MIRLAISSIIMAGLVAPLGCDHADAEFTTSDSGMDADTDTDSDADADSDADSDTASGDIDVDLSPETWEGGELEKYTEMQNTFPDFHPSVTSENGMIAGTSSALAVRSGLEVLTQGGTAADAAIATAMAQIALVIGSYVSYAGIWFATYYDKATDRVYYLNAGYNTPLLEDDPLTIPEMDSGIPSGRTTLVPGFFAGVEAFHERFGKLSFSSLFDPAIYFAETGFELTDILEYYIEWKKESISRLPETKAIFTKENGDYYASGDWFKQPTLAATLKRVAEEGSEYIYRGDWATHFVTAVQNDDGTITSEDMDRYEAVWSDPLVSQFGDYTVYAPGHPSAGGVNTVEALNLFEAAGFPERGLYTEDAEAFFWFTQIQRLMLLGYLDEATLDLVGAGTNLDLSPESRATKANATILWELMESGQFYFAKIPGTKAGTHSDSIVAVDKFGNVCALTHSINTVVWGETGIFVDGISIPDSATFQQQRMVIVGPGNRMPEATNPSIAKKNGQPYLASSSIGNTHYRTVPVLYNMLLRDLDIESGFAEPYLLTPDFTVPTGAGIVDRVTDGLYDATLLEEAIALGANLQIVPAALENEFRGYWLGITIDPETGKLTGQTSSGLNGAVLGH